MFRIISISLLFSLLAILLGLSACEKEQMADLRAPYVHPIDPTTQVNELSRALIINGTNVDGTIPESSENNDLNIIHFQPSASITNDNVLFIPFTFQVNENIAGIYLYVAGADNHWNVPIATNGSNVYVLDVGIPPQILEGDFTIFYQLYDQSGNVGALRQLYTNVVAANSGCGRNGVFPRVEGSDGMTVRTYDPGDVAGTVQIAFETYSVPDRVDVRYNNEWIRSTGDLLSNTTPNPPIKLCQAVVPGDGFIGTRGVFEFPYDPAISRKVDVYVSGCLDNSTLWYYNVYCPEATDTGEGSEADPFVGLPNCPCTYMEAQDLANRGAAEDGSQWLDCGGASQKHHIGATSEVRWAPPTMGDLEAGQQCTYDENGFLITSGIAAGSPDITSPRACGLGGPFAGEWYEIVDNSGAHYLDDVVPWGRLSCEEYLRRWPANNGNRCRNGNKSSNPVNDIENMSSIFRNMTCAKITGLIQLVDGRLDRSHNLSKYMHGELSNYSNENVRNDFIELRELYGCEFAPSEPQSDDCIVIHNIISRLFF